MKVLTDQLHDLKNTSTSEVLLQEADEESTKQNGNELIVDCPSEKKLKRSLDNQGFLHIPLLKILKHSFFLFFVYLVRWLDDQHLTYKHSAQDCIAS